MDPVRWLHDVGDLVEVFNERGFGIVLEQTKKRDWFGNGAEFQGMQERPAYKVLISGNIIERDQVYLKSA